MEIWKDIEGYEGLYQVSNLGRVKGLERIIYNPLKGDCLLKERILKPTISNNGYPMIGVSKYNKHKLFLVHRLVALAFIPNPENKLEINHINGIKTDHSIDNLEWCTRTENVQHALRNGLNVLPKGSRHYKSTLTDEQVLEIKTSNLKPVQLAKIYNVNASVIYKIVQGKTYLNVKLTI